MKLQQRLMLMNGITAFDATMSVNIVRFHGIMVHRLLTKVELDKLRAGGKS